MSQYTKADQDALDHLGHMARFGWAALTGRGIRRNSMVRLSALGLVRDAGLVAVAVVDGDGFTLEPERFRQAWELTDAGKAEIERLKHAKRLLSGYLAPVAA